MPHDTKAVAPSGPSAPPSGSANPALKAIGSGVIVHVAPSSDDVHSSMLWNGSSVLADRVAGTNSRIWPLAARIIVASPMPAHPDTIVWGGPTLPVAEITL